MQTFFCHTFHMNNSTYEAFVISWHPINLKAFLYSWQPEIEARIGVEIWSGFGAINY